MSDDRAAKLEALVGKTVLVGIERVVGEHVRAREQFHGVIVAVDERVVTIEVAGTEELFTLPADPDGFLPARPGVYRLKETGQQVTNPDLTTVWTVHEKPQ